MPKRVSVFYAGPALVETNRPFCFTFDARQFEVSTNGGASWTIVTNDTESESNFVGFDLRTNGTALFRGVTNLARLP